MAVQPPKLAPLLTIFVCVIFPQNKAIRAPKRRIKFCFLINCFSVLIYLSATSNIFGRCKNCKKENSKNTTHFTELFEIVLAFCFSCCCCCCCYCYCSCFPQVLLAVLTVNQIKFQVHYNRISFSKFECERLKLIPKTSHNQKKTRI